MIDATDTEIPSARLRLLRTPPGGLVIPARFELLIGGYFGTSYAVRLQQNGLRYARYNHSENAVSPADAPKVLPLPHLPAWRRFAAELDALDVWAWHRYYPNVNGAQGGYGFQFRICFESRQLRCSGDNAFPGVGGEPVSIAERVAGDPFDQFCAAVSRLIGQPFR